MERIIKNIAVLEITSSAVKFAVGYSLDKTPHILYYKKFPLGGFAKEGRIIDSAALGEAIAELNLVNDEDLKIKVNTNNVSLIPPPIGFHVFQNEKSTSLVHETVEEIDITNVTGMISRDEVPHGSRIVDIVPECYILDNGTPYSNPPLGNRGTYLSLRAKIYTLPDSVYSSYVQAANRAGLDIQHTGVATRCATQLILASGGRPEHYFYVDIGSKITNISLIGNSSPYGSLSTNHAGEELSIHIAKTLGISFEEADRLKIKYGYDERITKFSSPIMTRNNEDGTKVVIKQEQLNKAILDYYSQFINYINAAIETLAKNQLRSQNQNDADISRFLKLPIVISGGGSALHGIEKVLSSLTNGGTRTIETFAPTVIGARDPGATNICGLIVAEGEYKGTLEDSYHRVSTLTRGN